MFESDQDLAVFFDAADFAEVVTYRPSVGAARPVTAILSRGATLIDLGSVGMSVPVVTALVRVSEVPDPRDGDAITLSSGVQYRVRDRTSDPHCRVWQLNLQEL